MSHRRPGTSSGMDGRNEHEWRLHNFVLVLSGVSEPDSQLEDDLFEACDDAVLAFRNGVLRWPSLRGLSGSRTEPSECSIVRRGSGLELLEPVLDERDLLSASLGGASDHHEAIPVGKDVVCRSGDAAAPAFHAGSRPRNARPADTLHRHLRSSRPLRHVGRPLALSTKGFMEGVEPIVFTQMSYELPFRTV